MEGWGIPRQRPEYNSFAHISLSDWNVTHARPWWHRIVSGEGLCVRAHKGPLAPSNPTDSSLKSVITFKDYRCGSPHTSPTQAGKGEECQLSQSFQGTASGLPASLPCELGLGTLGDIHSSGWSWPFLRPCFTPIHCSFSTRRGPIPS